MKMVVQSVDAEKFIRTWQSSGNVKEVVEKLQLDKEKILQRANYFRSHKIPLKKMPKGVTGIDWENLRKVARTISNN